MVDIIIISNIQRNFYYQIEKIFPIQIILIYIFCNMQNFTTITSSLKKQKSVNNDQYFDDKIFKLLLNTFFNTVNINKQKTFVRYFQKIKQNIQNAIN